MSKLIVDLNSVNELMELESEWNETILPRLTLLKKHRVLVNFWVENGLLGKVEFPAALTVSAFISYGEQIVEGVTLLDTKGNKVSLGRELDYTLKNHIEESVLQHNLSWVYDGLSEQFTTTIIRSDWVKELVENIGMTVG